MSPLPTLRHDPWEPLRRLTPARIALGRAGGSLPTRQLLDFQLAHARARDAVHQPFAPLPLIDQLKAHGLADAIPLHTRAADRVTYLRNPDLGRRLSEQSANDLKAIATAPADLCIILADGLSAAAPQRHAVPLLAELLPLAGNSGWSLTPIAVVSFARVAVQDEIGELLAARTALILIGERPGLSAADSLGAYLVYQPQVGNTDAQRNCVSNIRPAGLPFPRAAQVIHRLLDQMFRQKTSGVALKNDHQLTAR